MLSFAVLRVIGIKSYGELVKIAYVHSAYTRNLPSGENSVVEAQCDALRAEGHDVIALVAETDELSSRPLYKLKSFTRVALGLGKSPTKIIKDFNPEFVIIHNLFPNFGSHWIKKLKKFDKNLRICVFIHNFRMICASGDLLRNGKHCDKCLKSNPINSLFFRCYRGSFFYTFPLYLSQILGVSKRNILDKVDCIFFLSHVTRNEFRKVIDFKSETRILPNFVPESVEVNFNTRKKIDNGKWVVVARLTVEKGVAKLVSNWPSELSLDIFGMGPELGKIQELIKDKPNIVLKGLGSPIELGKILPNYFAAVHPSICIEVAPLTVLEFHRAGLPILYTGNNFSPFENEVPIAGLVLDRYDSTSICEAAKVISQNYNDYSQSSRSSYLNYYSQKSWLLKFQSALEQIQNSEM